MPEPSPGACQIDLCCDERAAACERLSAAEDQRCRAERAAMRLEATLDEAVKQCVTLERLCGTVDHREVLRAIQDVVVNLVGSEELAVFEVTDDGGDLEVTLSTGVSDGRLLPIRLGQGPLGKAAAEGRSWFRGDGTPPGDPDLHAWVPLSVEGRVVAALAVWRLLSHKPELHESDRRVLRLLGSHAGNALYLTSPHPRRSRAA
jgi:hypothetical protein